MLLTTLTSRTAIQLCLLALGAAVLYQWTVKLLSRRRDVEFGRQQGCQPPKWVLPTKLPLGVDIVVRGFRASRQKKLLDFMTDYFHQTGPTIQIDLLGGRGYATMDPENVEAILSGKFDDFELGIRSLGFRALVGEGIFTQDDQAWKHSRELLRHRFARMQYQNLKGFQEHIEHLIDVVKECNGIVDLQPHFYRMTLETTIATILGQPVENFSHETGDEFATAFARATLITATRVRLGVNYWMYSPKGFFESCSIVRSFVERSIKGILEKDQAAKESANKDNFIHDLTDDYHDVSLVRDQVLNILLAGRDTTATTITFAIRLLLRNTNALRKLRDEIEATVGDDTNITRAHIQQMPYLRNVINEVLRLRAPVPLNSRFCRRATTLPRGGGEDGQSPILLRKGDSVAYSVYHMHRRKDYFGEDALDFKPERWDSPEIADIKWAFLPFNGGPRVCLGKDFGFMLASYSIVRILQAFPSMSLAPGEPRDISEGERQDVGLVLSCPDGCKVVLE